MPGLIGTFLDALAGRALAVALWGADRLYRQCASKTGYANPRVRHITGLGYSLRSYQIIWPNMRAWLADRRALFPAVLQVQTVNRCNATCPMCPYPYTIHLQPRQVMPDALFSKIARECAAEPGLLDFVPMSKNEPLLDRKLAPRIAEFKGLAGPHQMVEIVTNGSLLTPERFDRLAEAGVDLITVSVNAADEATYAQVMAGLSWPRLMANLDGIAARMHPQVNLFVRFVKQQGNRAQARRFAGQWRRRGFNVFAYDVNNRSGTVAGYDRLRLAKRRVVQGLRKRIGRWLFPVCPYAFSVAHVLENGDMPLCANDWHNRELLGNVGDTTIRAIFNSPRLNEIRALMEAGRYDEIAPCRDCSFRHDWLS